MGGILGEPLGQDQLSTHEFVAHLRATPEMAALRWADSSIDKY